MIRVETDADQTGLARCIAQRMLELLISVQDSEQDPVVVLTGGSMGDATLSAVAEHPLREAVQWEHVTLVWGDERWLPSGDSERNEVQADHALLRALPLDSRRVHRLAASDAGMTLDAAAETYAAIIDALPRIDLALFGVGPDGHVASLFPGREDLLARGKGVAAALPVRNSPKPPPERVSLSIDAICRAERVWLLAAGAEKHDAVRGVLSPAAPLLPAARISGRSETVLWADAAAMGTLPI